MASLPTPTPMVVQRLAAAGCVAAEEEAAELLAAVDDATLESWIARRERGEPLAWIVGGVSFAGRRVAVDAGLYVPRYESEELAHRAAQLLAASPCRCAADLCTGCGAVAVHLAQEVPAATVVGVDIDRRAVACARRNGVGAVQGDLGEPLRPGAFDVVTAVPPYVPTAAMTFLPADVQRYEPRRALDGGVDGLVTLRRVVVSAARLLRPGGWLLVELGGEQDRELRPALEQEGFASLVAWGDADGDLRGLAAQRGE